MRERHGGWCTKVHLFRILHTALRPATGRGGDCRCQIPTRPGGYLAK
jgi:hypothetical protein